MSDFLVNFAVNNFWCNPQQDKQGIFQIARITPFTGVTNSVTLMQRSLALPTKLDTYHVFQIGQLSPFIIGLITQNPYWSYQSWQPMSEVMNILPVFVDVYNTNGIHVPRFEVFYRFTQTRDLILAIKVNPNIPVNYQRDNFYLRVYSNAYFQLQQNQPNLFYAGGTFLNSNDILNFQILYNKYAAMPGFVFCYCNGLLIDSISLITCPVGSTIEFIYDSSVKRQFTTPMTSIQTFVSILDSCNKYLLHDSSSLNKTINYQDDIEVYIINPLNGHYSGVYYHRNNPGSHRMVTHRDYAINVNYATSLMEYFQSLPNSNITSLNQLSILTVIRNSGFNHSLVYENNRIEELYKLSDAQVVQAMVGVNSTNPIWQAPNLENSLYTKVMRSQVSELNDTLVQNALGYNAYSKYIADTPSFVYSSSGQLQANVPLGLQSGFCAYEYDANGNFLGYTNNLTGSTYMVVNPTCAKVEMLYGFGGTTAPAYLGINSITFNANANYRVYRCNYLNTGYPDNNWVDVTSSGNYTVSNNILTWNVPNDNQYLMIRTDERIVNYDLSLLPQDGLIYFTFSEMQNRDGNLQNYIATVPMSDISIYLNNHILVEGIDYIIQYPEVVIINFSYMAQPANTTAQNIHVRMSGFCNPDLTYNKPYDVGFIADNAFSNSYRYDIMDDTVNRIVVGSKYLTMNDLQINDSKAGVTLESGYNGLPYALEKPMIPIENLKNTDLLTFINASKANDTLVSNYLSLYLPKAQEPLTSMPALYQVTSPFICKIIYQLLNNEANNMNLITPTMSDNDIITFCTPYLKWLNFDPISAANTIDPRFISILPLNTLTTVQLPLTQYRFILRVIALYAQNPMVSMSSFIQLKPLS